MSEPDRTPLGGEPFRDKVTDPKILDRMFEWVRTADDKASRFAVLALGLSLFWIYYSVLIPATASSRATALGHDLNSLDHLLSRLTEVQVQMRKAATVHTRRSSPNNQSIPFFADVLLHRLIHDSRITLAPEQRRAADTLRANLIDLSIQLERYRAFYETHAPARNDWPAKTGDPSQVLANLERAEDVMLQLLDLNTQAVNAEWLDAVERTLIADGERVRLGATITASLAPYEPLVGTWAPPQYKQPAGLYREIAARNVESPPTTFDDLRRLREKLKLLRDEAVTDLQIRRLRVPFTDIEVDRRLFLAIGPVVVILLYHYLVAYLVLARQIETFIIEMWGYPAADAAAQLRPSDALFRSFDESPPVPRLVRWSRRPVRWLIRVVIPAVPAVLVVTAIVVSWQNAAIGFGGVVLGLAILCGAYAVLLAYGLWKLI